MIKEHKSGKWSPELTAQEQQTLFAIAEETLKWCVAGKTTGFDFSGYEITKKLTEKTATFVTLKINHNLRGCIGTLVPIEELYKSIHHNAINAAIHDHRFMPVTNKDLPAIDIHLSILSPITEIKTIDDFNIGEHGIIIEKGRYSAVFLPEVAIEQHWTKTDTLEALSQKAGMAKDAWKEDTKYQIFSSVALSNKK
jgi:AmmeMemoRadiSam system protein A